MIKTWDEAKAKDLTQEALQELCDYDLAFKEKIKCNLRRKHPTASEKQLEAWANGALRRKMQQEMWGWSPIRER